MYRTYMATIVGVLLTCRPVFAQPVGPQFYGRLDQLPLLWSNVESYYLSSYDRTGGNDDGFRGTYSRLYVDDRGEHVIFDEKGPGCVYNLWFTGSGRNLHWGKLRFYFDDDEEPRIEMDAKDFFSGRNSPLVYPLVTHSFVSSGGFSCSVPFPFAERLKITTEKTVGFYNIYYQLYKDVSLKSWQPHHEQKNLVRLFNSCGSDPKPVPEKLFVESKPVTLAPAAGKRRQVEIISTGGPGVIQHIKINPLYNPDKYSLNHVYLRIFYDGREKPSVDVPIGPFFGSGLGEADVRGMFVGMSSSGAYYCYWPMPFQESIRIVLENRSHDSGGDFFCEVGYTRGALDVPGAARLGYFGAKYNTAWPIVEQKDYVLFNYEGTGAVVGQVMTVEPVKPDRKRWWEGDMRIYIDKEDQPRFHGTGHEDEYQGGWSTFWLTNPYSLPLFGQPKTTDLIDVYGQVNGSATAYRFWPGKIHFDKSIKISTEHGNHNDTPANYSSVVYYYYVKK